jgi:hypothetical protein
MFRYYLELGLRSLGLNPALTALMIVLIGAGVASSMITFAALRAISADPLPAKSAQLFVPQLDNFGPANDGADGEPPLMLSYIDAMALLHAHRGRRETALYAVSLSLVPADAARAPFTVKGLAVTRDMFAMFDVPFLYGTGWSNVDDESGANALVLSRRLNDRLFGGVNSVGNKVHLNQHDYRVVGVEDDWNPQPRFYAGADIHDAIDKGDAPDQFSDCEHGHCAGDDAGVCVEYHVDEVLRTAALAVVLPAVRCPDAVASRPTRRARPGAARRSGAAGGGDAVGMTSMHSGTGGRMTRRSQSRSTNRWG